MRGEEEEEENEENEEEEEEEEEKDDQEDQEEEEQQQEIEFVIPGEILQPEYIIFQVSYRFQTHYRNKNKRTCVLNGYRQNRWKVEVTLIPCLLKCFSNFFFLKTWLK